MRYIILSLLIFATFSTMAQQPKDICVQHDSYIEIAMKDAMLNESGIDIKLVNNQKTSIILLSKTKVGPIFSTQLAKRDQINSGANPRKMTRKDYSSTYTDGNVYNLIVKFTFEDNAGKENIFIGSAFRNDDECSVGFGGYITVERGF